MRIAKEAPERLQVWFWDEAGFSLRVIRRKQWSKKGSRKQVSGSRKKGRFSVMGGVRFSDKKRIVDFISKGTGETFFDVLKGFYRELKYEWAGEAKNPDAFEKLGPKIVIVLDNASIHKKKGILEQIAKEMPLLVQKSLESLMRRRSHDETGVTEKGMTWEAQVSTQEATPNVYPPAISSTANSIESMDCPQRPTPPTRVLRERSGDFASPKRLFEPLAALLESPRLSGTQSHGALELFW